MKKLTLIVLFALLMAVAVFAAITNTIIVNSPTDGSFDHDGNLTFDINVQVAEGRNITNVSIWHNISGTWVRDQNLSNNSLSGFGGVYSSINMLFREWKSNLSDGTSFIWGVEVRTNSSIGDYQSNWSTNNTVRVEYPPNITINYPNTNSNFTSSFLFNFTASSAFIPPNELNDSFVCDVFTNSTNEANLTKLLGRVLVNNGTNQSMLVDLPEAKTLGMTVKCWETLRPAVVSLSNNITVGVDKTGPTALFETNITNGITNVKSVQVNFTITDANPQELLVYLNTSGNAWTKNFSFNRIANGQRLSFSLQNLSDGTYTIGGYLWDSVAEGLASDVRIPNVTSNLTHNATLNNHTFVVDTITPSISALKNRSVTGLLVMEVSFSTNENTTANVTYGNSTTSMTSYAVSRGAYNGSLSGVNYNHSINITLEEFKTYYYNITFCDMANNCNSTRFGGAPLATQTIAPQTPIYAGWNAYGLFNDTVEMGKLYNDTGADYIYWWNASSRSWVGHTGGTGSQASTVLFGGSVVWLFKSTNGTWQDRDTSVRDAFRLNLSSGGNFVGAQFSYNFTNLSISFLNRTAYVIDSFVMAENATVGGTANGLGSQKVEISTTEFFSYYNNSNQRYVSYFRNETFNNASLIPRGWAIFVSTGSNVTWNGTSVVTNWTVSG